MSKIAVIGIGNLGLRHLESLVKSEGNYELFAVEPFDTNLRNAIKYFDLMRQQQNILEVSFLQSVEGLPSKLDVVIIASGANIRFEIVHNLLECKKVGFLVLEKVLFQKISDYKECAELLKKSKTTTFVNCPMRSYDNYSQIKSFFGDDIPLKMTVTGADWSLGCNAVHYLDLFAFLTGNPANKIVLNLDTKLKESKRPGYIEFSWMLNGFSESGQITLQSIENSGVGKIILIFSKDKYCVIDEYAHYYILGSSSYVSEMKVLSMPYQSDLTAIFVKQILETETCSLSSYDESMAIHLPLMEALLEHIKNVVDKNLDYVPIT